MKTIKNILYGGFLLTVLIYFISCASSRYEKANVMYENTHYSEAAELYEKALEKKAFPDGEIKLADSYRKMNNTIKAEVQYRRALEKTPDKFGPKEHLHFAQVLKANEKYEEAKIWLQAYLNEFPSDKLAQNLFNSCDSATCLKEEVLNYQINKLKHPEELISAFSPVVYKNGLMYVAETRGKNKRYKWTGNSFLHLYYSELTKDSLSLSQELPGKINTPYHEGPASLSSDMKTLWFTRTYMEKKRIKKTDNNVNHVGIYYSVMEDGKWINIKPFSFNNKEYSTGHPSLSSDGNLLFHISDKPGGYGGTDIYVSEYRDELWSEPKNMGPEINSPGNEMFPYVTEVNGTQVLYFSSNGHKGMGGLDVFRTVLHNTEMLQREHLGRPFNSAKDDFGLAFTSEEKAGFFSSNRGNDEGKDELYRFTSLDPDFFLEGQVFNGLTEKSFPGAKLVLKDLLTGLEFPMTAGDEGRFIKRLEKDHQYQLFAWENDFQADTIEFSTVNLNPGDKIQVKLQPKPYFFLEGRVINKETGNPVEDAVVDLVIPCLKEKRSFKTEKGGRYKIKVDTINECLLMGRKQNLYTNSKQIIPAMFADTNIVFSDLLMEEIELNKTIRLEQIYYNYNSAELSREAMHELDKLIGILKVKPELKIEVSSHTDSRGSNQYNLTLSQKRAQTVVSYVVSKGIKPDRIKAKGLGETQLLNRCGNGSDCNEEEHKYNRRTEFTVIHASSGNDKL